jgi:hypothetical protein
MARPYGAKWRGTDFIWKELQKEESLIVDRRELRARRDNLLSAIGYTIALFSAVLLLFGLTRAYYP